MKIQYTGSLKKSLLGLIIALSFICLQATSVAQDDANGNQLKVGDLVQFDIFRDTYEGRITRFTGTGWPFVEYERNGRTATKMVPNRDVTLVEESSNESGDGMPSAAMRTWTDTTGSFTIKAKMLSNKNGKIELEKEDGRVITLPAAKLCEADQAYLAAQAKAVADETDEDNPFAGGTAKPNRRSNGRRSGRGTTNSAAGTATVITPEYEVNSMVLSGADWKVTPDPSVPVEGSKKILGFSSKLTGHEVHSRLAKPAISFDKKALAASVSNAFDENTEIVAFNLESGASTKPALIPFKKSKIFAVSGDASIVVTNREQRGADAGGLDFWKLSDGEAKHAMAWKTAGFHDRNGFSPQSGQFIGTSRLLTFGRRIVLWDCETSAALYSFPVPSKAQPAMSPGTNQLAVSTGNTIYIVSVKDGEVLGSFDHEGEPISRLAFSDNGKYLAGLSTVTGEVFVWDLATAAVLRQFSSPNGSGKTIQWCGNKYILVNSTDLMDVELRASVWKYDTGSESIVSAQDGRFWVVAKSKLTPVKLPHKNLDALTAKFDPDDLLMLQPGSEVSIKLDVSFPPSQQRNIIDKLTAALGARDIVVRDGAELQFHGTVKKGERQTKEVSSVFGGFGRGKTEKISYTPTYASLVLLKDGEKVWVRGTTYSAGGIFQVNEGESTQQAANRCCQPNPAFFTSVKFPKYISRLPSGPLGTTKVGK